MDKAYESNKTLALTKDHEFNAVIPPKKNRKSPWSCGKHLYKQRNNIEQYFLKLKRFRKVFTRCDKFNSIFTSTIFLAFIFALFFI